MPYDKFYINGTWAKPAGSDTIEIVNPATEETIVTLPLGTVEDANAAVAAAKAAFPAWSQTTTEERAVYIEKIAAGLEARADEIAETLSREMGMPLKAARMIQVGLPQRTFKSYATIVRDYAFESGDGATRILREPIGVCGFITPWNYPLHQIAGKVAPALAAGCTMVLKPSEMAPLNAYILAEIIHEAGLPAGVFNLVNGNGPVVGEAIASHPDVDMVSFTGSTRAGKRVAELGAQTVKRVTQELGGKSPNIILDDADLTKAIPAGVMGCYANSGQTCSAPTRMIVPRAKLPEVEVLAKAAAEACKMGDPFDETSTHGPIVHAAQYDKVQDLIQVGIDEGAKLVTGGTGRPEGIEKGYFTRPTVFSNVTSDMTIARDEIFGPVLSIIPYDTEEEAVEIANDTIYGLAGRVWSGDHDRARRVARRIRAGQIHINEGRGSNEPAPFGGYKQSGNGREFGTWGLEEYLEVKAVMGW
ncbi:MAG: aldehyde dehydrogenase family protein [Tepidiformaceae bacterium]